MTKLQTLMALLATNPDSMRVRLLAGNPWKKMSATQILTLMCQGTEFEYGIAQELKRQISARVPIPESEIPERGTEYYVASTFDIIADGTYPRKWVDSYVDHKLLRAGLIYRSPADARERVEAMLGTEVCITEEMVVNVVKIESNILNPQG